MSKLDMVQNLQNTLGEMKEIASELDADILQLKKIRDAGEFISDELNEEIRKYLETICARQREFVLQYEKLEVGTLPVQISQAESRLEEYKTILEHRTSYLHAVEFFKSLHAEDEKTEQLLEKRKRELDAEAFEKLDAEALKEKTECYVWLKEAYYEKDERKKFSLIYRLVSYFEEEIAAGVQFASFKIEENCAEPESGNGQQVSDRETTEEKLAQENCFESESGNGQQVSDRETAEEKLAQENCFESESGNGQKVSDRETTEQNAEQENCREPESGNEQQVSDRETAEQKSAQENCRESESGNGQQASDRETTEEKPEQENYLEQESGNEQQASDRETTEQNAEQENYLEQESGNEQQASDRETTEQNAEQEKCRESESGNEQQVSDRETTEQNAEQENCFESESGNEQQASDREATGQKPAQEKCFELENGNKQQASEMSVEFEEITEVPEAILVKEDTSLLTVESSAKAASKFGVKEFKKDMEKHSMLTIEKIYCLKTAYDGCGYTTASISLKKEERKESLILATEKLFQLGYLTKYTVDGYGTFYCLSERGNKAFRTKESCSYLYLGKFKRKYRETEEEYIEDTANSAILRVLYFSVMSRMKQIYPKYVVETEARCLGTNFFLKRFLDTFSGKNIVFVGIVSEKLSEFCEFVEKLREDMEGIGRLVVIGMNTEHAEHVAQWLADVLQTDKAEADVWYVGYHDEKMMDLATGEEINPEEDSEKDKLQSGENEETDVHAGKNETDLEETKSCAEETKEESGEIESDTEENETAFLSSAFSETECGEEETDFLDRKEFPKSGETEVQGKTKKSKKEKAQKREKTKEKETLKTASQNPFGSIAALPEELENIENTNVVEETHETVYQKMLCGRQFYSAAAYLKALSKKEPEYEQVYRQLAYALNDPMESCSYSSDDIFQVYYNSGTFVSEYFVAAAAIRNYFLDQFSYDYSLQQLQSMLAGNTVLNRDAVLQNIVYTLMEFKTAHKSGIDRYADYRKKEHAFLEQRLEEVKKEAESYYENYIMGNLKENASHRRFLETRKLLFHKSGDLSEYLTAIKEDNREMLEMMEEFLKETYIKDNAEISAENIDSAKIDIVLDEYWVRAAENMNVVKKTSDLMSSLRMNLSKMVSKVTGVLCDYVSLLKKDINQENSSGYLEYKKIRASLLSDIRQAEKNLMLSIETTSLSECAGKHVLFATLKEMESRLDGTYKDGTNKFFYVNFLKNDKVVLNEEYFPVLDEVLELPEFSVMTRIKQHFSEEEKEFGDRLQEIINGGDDYGSAELILAYLKTQEIPFEPFEDYEYKLEKAMIYPQKDMENKRSEFIEDLELAQSYGQIDNTVENSKEMMIQIMDTWYSWASATKNYGFFSKILKAFMDKIKQDARVRAGELESSLEVYLKGNPDWKESELIEKSVEQIEKRIEQQNYAAAEDLLNRLMTNDIDFETDIQQTDYLAQFLDEYESNYRKTAKSGSTLISLLNMSRSNKDTKGGKKLVESWPKGAGVGETNLKILLELLGFQTDEVKKEEPIQGKIENYFVKLKRPKNGRKSNYKHTIAAFGSEAEKKEFRVVCIFGKTDAGRLIDTFKEIGNAKHTLVLLDYALTLSDRRILARKTKTDLTGKTFAVIDRVVLAYLAKQYNETAVNRMLMSVIMPFASYQPYIMANGVPQEIFIGRKNELEKIESPTGVNIVYGGRQLGKTTLLRMAKEEINMNENGDRAIIVSVSEKNYKETAKEISKELYDEGFLKHENVTEDWSELAHDIKNRLRDKEDPIPYFLLMIDEADAFIESCEEVKYQPFNELENIQGMESGRFKFVVAGLHNTVRFKKMAALSNNSVLTKLDSLTVKPFKAMEARELLEVPLSYLGFRFQKDNETEVLISTIFGTTNYFPGLIQLYCIKLIEAMRRDYAGYSESETPPYIVKKEHIKKVLAEQSLQQEIREKFFITLKAPDDDYYYIIALFVAYHYHKNKSQNGCSASDLHELAEEFEIKKLAVMEEEKLTALMEELRELNVLQCIGEGRYRFTRHSFCQMMGTVQQIDDELLKYMGE